MRPQAMQRPSADGAASGAHGVADALHIKDLKVYLVSWLRCQWPLALILSRAKRSCPTIHRLHASAASDHQVRPSGPMIKCDGSVQHPFAAAADEELINGHGNSCFAYHTTQYTKASLNLTSELVHKLTQETLATRAEATCCKQSKNAVVDMY